MKKLVVFLILVLFAAGFGFARNNDDTDGALGFGIFSQNGNGNVSSDQLKFGGFFDLGWQLVGPVHIGFELQGDAQNVANASYVSSQTFFDVFFLDPNTYITVAQRQDLQYTWSFWSLDLSPRIYASIDLQPVQLLAFAGVSKNWVTYDYTVTAESTFTDANFHTWHTGDIVDQKNGQPYTESPWGVVMGARVTLLFVYLDYTRFLSAGGSLSWNSFTTDTFSAGINFRF